jgi:Mrp family chromosome partitioning ATPase
MTPQIMDSLLPAAFMCAAGAAGVAIFGIGRKNKGDKAALPESGAGSAIDEPVYPNAEEPTAPQVPPAAVPEYEEEEDSEPAPLDEYGEPITLPGLPLLGVVPSLSLEALAEGHGLLLHRQPELSPAAEAYRSVWERLGVYEKSEDGSYDDEVNSVRVLAVAGAEPGEGVSTTTANLAMAAARLGYTVLVVDADLARPTQHLLLGRAVEPRRPGPRRPADEGAGHPPAHRVGPADGDAARPPDPRRLVPAHRPRGGDPLRDAPRDPLRAVTGAGHGRHRALRRAPAVGGGPGGDVVGQTSGVILVVDSDRRESPRVRMAVRALEKMGASMLGGIVVPAGSDGDHEGTPAPVRGGRSRRRTCNRRRSGRRGLRGHRFPPRRCGHGRRAGGWGCGVG